MSNKKISVDKPEGEYLISATEMALKILYHIHKSEATNVPLAKITLPISVILPLCNSLVHAVNLLDKQSMLDIKACISNSQTIH